LLLAIIIDRYLIMNIKVLIIFCTLFASVLCACKKNDTEEKWAEEEAKLLEWISNNKPGLTLDNGIYIEKVNESPEDYIQPEDNDYVLVNYTCTFLFENIVEQVSDKDWKSQGAQNTSSYREGGPELWSPDMWRNKGIGQMREKERANVYIPSRILGLQDFKPRVFQMHLVKVIDTDLKKYQEKLMASCMKKFGNCVDTITISDKGRDYYVVYHIENEGTGAAVDVSTVKMHYNEFYLLQEGDHRTCVSNKEKTGWDKKFTKMFQSVKKGGKITVVMPYRIMYGEDPYKENGQFIAPVGSVLKYDITIEN
jgi:hypothetical protein